MLYLILLLVDRRREGGLWDYDDDPSHSLKFKIHLYSQHTGVNQIIIFYDYKKNGICILFKIFQYNYYYY